MRRLVPFIASTLIAASCTGSGPSTTIAATAAPPASTVPSSSTTSMPPPQTTSPQPTTAITSTTTTTTLPDDVDPEVAAALAAQIDELVAVTERIRGLPFVEPPKVSFLSHDMLDVRIRDILAASLDPEDAALQASLLTLLGLVAEGTDLGALYEDLYAEQVLGFYDGDTVELVVAADSAELSATSKVTLVHELIHALTDQHFAFHDRHADALDADAFDEAEALLALAEGDATYFQFIYTQEELSIFELLELAAETIGADSPVFDGAPKVVQDQLLFPYDKGFAFVDRLVGGGGIAAVDEAYQNPPLTTRDIFHPDRFLSGRPRRTIEIPRADLDGWQVYEEGTYGEFGLWQLFTGSFDDGYRTQLATGWEDDGYRIYRRDSDVAFVLLSQMVDEDNAVELAQALLVMARNQMGAGQGVDRAGGVEFPGAPYAFVDRVGDQVVFVASSDSDAGVSLRLLVGAGG
ncbi:MAG: hypothetical protein ACE5E8_08060 [Acidimicrobiia bacterium]